MQQEAVGILQIIFKQAVPSFSNIVQVICINVDTTADKEQQPRQQDEMKEIPTLLPEQRTTLPGCWGQAEVEVLVQSYFCHEDEDDLAEYLWTDPQHVAAWQRNTKNKNNIIAKISARMDGWMNGCGWYSRQTEFEHIMLRTITKWIEYKKTWIKHGVESLVQFLNFLLNGGCFARFVAFNCCCCFCSCCTAKYCITCY